MGIIDDITGKIAGNDEPADWDSEVRKDLENRSFEEQDPIISQRYEQCSKCEFLGEDFKLLGKKIVENTPQCTICGCSILLKAPMNSESCPMERW